MSAKPMITTWNEEENSTAKTVKIATVIGLALAALSIILLPNSLPLAKIAMMPMAVGVSYIITALICAQRGEPVYGLGLAGQGLGILAVVMLVATSILYY